MLWFDGQRVDGTVVPFDLRDRGLLLGDGIFDTALVLNGQIVFGAAHLDRLAAGCATLGIPFDHAKAEVTWRQAASDIGVGSIRMTVTAGPGPRGLMPPADPRPGIIVSGATGDPVHAFRPIRLVSTAIRRNETAPSARLKSLGYLDAIQAMREAKDQGGDDALFLNTQGRVACAGTGNLFMVAGQRLITPPLEDGVLDGITRGILLNLAEVAGLAAIEESFLPQDILSADGFFMTNSLRLVAQVTAIDGITLPNRATPLMSPIIDALNERIRGECGFAFERGGAPG